MASNEIILPHHNIISCFDRDDKFHCLSTNANNEEMNEANRNASVKFKNTAILLTNLNHRVIPYSLPSNLEINDPTDTKPLKRHEETTLSLLLSNARNLQPSPRQRSCDISPLPDKMWKYDCENSIFRLFEFTNDSTEIKYRSLEEELILQSKENDRYRIFAIAISTLTPIFIFLLLSSALWALRRIVRFVVAPTS